MPANTYQDPHTVRIGTRLASEQLPGEPAQTAAGRSALHQSPRRRATAKQSAMGSTSLRKDQVMPSLS
jgi:hypothetical protein